MADQDLIRLRKPIGTYTSCLEKDLQIYLGKGFTVADEGQDDSPVIDEVDTDEDDSDDGDE